MRSGEKYGNAMDKIRLDMQNIAMERICNTMQNIAMERICYAMEEQRVD